MYKSDHIPSKEKEHNLHNKNAFIVLTTKVVPGGHEDPWRQLRQVPYIPDNRKYINWQTVHLLWAPYINSGDISDVTSTKYRLENISNW